jgi:uncharacterized repeat protein (TIGR01451 family)
MNIGPITFSQWLPKRIGRLLLWPATGTLLVLGMASYSHAAGTASGTVVSLGATADYQVAGVSQPQVSTAAPARFMVDTRVDLTVAESGSNYTDVAPGATNQTLIFTVTNTGNAPQDFALSAATVAIGGDDPIDAGSKTVDFTPTIVRVYQDVNANGSYDAGIDRLDYIDELAADASATVIIEATIPSTQTNGQVGACTLTATAANAGTAGTLGAISTKTTTANNDSLLAADADVAFGDGAGLIDAANDGKYSAADAFLVTSAVISISKSVALISDPLNGTTNPIIIPGAVLEYTITVTNAAGSGASATSVQVTDDLSSEGGHIAFMPDTYAALTGIRVTAPNINGGTATNLTNASDGDQGAFAANVVTVNGITLAPNESATVDYRVQVQ